MIQVLKNIIRVSEVRPTALRQLDIAHSKVIIRKGITLKALPLVGLANCEVSSKLEDRVRLFTTTLTAKLAEPLYPIPHKTSYLLDCADGSSYLLGNIEHPYPIVDMSETLPGVEKDPSTFTLTVTLTGIYPLLEVVYD